MPKLSDVFLNLVGSSLMGAGGLNPVEERQKQEALKQNQLHQQQTGDTARLVALAHLATQFDIQPPPQPSSGTISGMNDTLAPAMASPSPSKNIPVPGMSGYTMSPKAPATMNILPVTQDAQGNQTFGTPIVQPKGTKVVTGKPSASKGGPSQKDIDKEWANLESDINPGSFKNKTMSQNLAKKQSAEAVLKLLQQANGNPNVLQAPEIAQSVAMLLQSGGGRTAQEQLDKLTPRSLKGDIMKQISYFSGQPAGLEQQSFFKSLSDTAQREGSLRASQIVEEQLSRLPRHEHLSKIDPQNYARILAAHGVDLNQRDKTGAPIGAGLLGQGNANSQSVTGDAEADSAIMKIQASSLPELEKQNRIAQVKSRVGK